MAAANAQHEAGNDNGDTGGNPDQDVGDAEAAGAVPTSWLAGGALAVPCTLSQ